MTALRIFKRCLNLRAVDAALRAIADPRRREILSLVSGRELPAGEIASRFDVTWPAISQHLRVLKDAGLVSERRDGRRRLYRARREGLADLVAFLGTFWDERLDALRAAAEAERRAESARTAPTAPTAWANRPEEQDGRDR